MTEDGMKGFAAFAREQNFTGTSRDQSPSWNSNFKKRAPLPDLGEHRGRGGESARSDRPRGERPSHRSRERRGDRSDQARPRKGSRSRRRDHRTNRGSRDGGPSREDRGSRRREGSRSEFRHSRIESIRSLSGERERSGDLPVKNPFHPSLIRPEVQQHSWRKRAASMPGSEKGSFSPSPPPSEKEESRSAFEKKALVPTFPPEEHRELRIREVKPVAGATARASKDKEAASMRTFDERCLVLYNDLLGMDQEMEITHMLSGVFEGSWGEAFADLTRPKRASTGLIYVRMMEDYLKWHKKQQESAGGDKVLLPSCKDVFWLYLHHVKTDRVGKYSPKAAHLALRYFADCFGFSDEAVTYRRVKKLVENCSKLEEPRNQAEMIPVATLDFLETAVSDHTLNLGVRIAAGKLRLCVQGSLRWDDLSRTPFGHVEWVRRKGSLAIVGLRSKDAQSKTGARPWVASYLGVTVHSDDWMAILVQLLLEVHGAAWKSHDHTGKSFTSDGRNSKTAVASFQQDVTFVRALLVDAVEKGLDIGLTREQAAGLRWHGAKSTLTSFMMHCKVGSRTVRFAGNWKDQRESTPDTYLREAQLVVLDAQEEVLKYIRGGGFVATLEGLPLCAGASLGPEESESKEYQEALEDIDRIRKAAPKPTGLESKDVARAVLDEVASNGGDELEKQLELEKITVVDPSSVEAILDEAFESRPADSPAERSEEAGDDSSDEFYDSCYLQVPQSLRGSFHRPSGVEIGLPRCGTKARSFMPVSVEEKLGKKASFCMKCYGKLKPGGCDKTCSHTKVIVVDKQEILVRCSRRCERKCEKLAGFLDVDDRDHRCSIHEDAIPDSNDEEQPEAPESDKVEEDT